jgi:heptosyltransferase-2
MRADYPSRMTPTGHPPLASQPLVVRLRNWVGDVVLAVPTLQRLSDAGYALQLVGKGWARDLLAAHSWPVHVLPSTLRERVNLLAHLRREITAGVTERRRGIDALCLPDSFSSALDFRLSGLRALGHAWEGRSLLLARAVPRARGVHELDIYWRLGSALLGHDAALPAAIGLRVSEQHRAQAQALRAAHGIEPACVVICPFAGGTWDKQDKTWPGFASFAAQVLPTLGRSVVVCPGPGEEDIARQHFASARMLPGVGLGTYAALLHDAALMVSNDTGPGHMAAAVGTPLVSVLGPSKAALWHAWGSNVRVLGGDGQWPDAVAVREAATQALQAR